MPLKPIPDGYRSITPYFFSSDAKRFLQFIKDAFDATEGERMDAPDGKIMHAQATIGDSLIMFTDGSGGFPPSPASLYLYIQDVDAIYRRALQAGATSVMKPMNQFYGDRSCGVKDPCGNFRWIATHVEDVSSEELKRRHESGATKQ